MKRSITSLSLGAVFSLGLAGLPSSSSQAAAIRADHAGAAVGSVQDVRFRRGHHGRFRGHRIHRGHHLRHGQRFGRVHRFDRHRGRIHGKFQRYGHHGSRHHRFDRRFRRY